MSYYPYKVDAIKQLVRYYKRTGAQVVINPYLERYDRRAISVVRQVSVNPGANTRAQTIDWKYKVPQARLAFVESAFAHVQNNSSTALNGEAGVEIGFDTGLDDDTNVLNYFIISILKIEVGQSSISKEIVLHGVTLQPGEVLAGISNSGNNAVGTNVTIESSTKITEFDA